MLCLVSTVYLDLVASKSNQNSGQHFCRNSLCFGVIVCFVNRLVEAHFIEQRCLLFHVFSVYYYAYSGGGGDVPLVCTYILYTVKPHYNDTSQSVFTVS